jgi:type IV pilus assembly protein PilW
MRTARQALRPRGMTLIELMVGLAVGLFLVVVMGAIYVGSKGTFNAQESTSRLQENGRFAVDTLAASLRMSGFRGCAGQVGQPAAVNNVLQGSGALLYNFGRPLAGSHYTGSAWLPALDAAITALSPSTGSDVITVYRPASQGWSLTAEMADASASLNVSATTNIAAGDLLVVSDCNGAAVFQATNSNPGAGTIEHKAGVSGISPGVTGNSLGRPYLQDAAVYRLQSVTYYIAASARQSGLMALWSWTSPDYTGTAQPVELVTGVERLAVTFGLDTNADQAADKFVSADGVTDWTQVVSTRLELLLQSPDANTALTPQPYVFGGVTTTPTDRRMRTVITLVTSLRNSVP